MEKEWHKIISFNGSQANAFEELVCQIALNEINTQFKFFERVGTPDGGVECYWLLRDNTEWGWQAKYYESLNSSEWNNIKNSLFDAIETHPSLAKYFICLPHNLSDGRRGKKTQKDIWENYKKEWENEIIIQGKKVEIVFWSSTIIVNRILLPQNIGLKLHFFNEISIDEQQLNIHLDAAILNLGPKYSKDLNFKVDYLPTVFDALSRNEKFQIAFEKTLDSFLISIKEVISDCSKFDETSAFNKSLQVELKKIILLYKEVNFLPNSLIPSNKFIQLVNNVSKIVKKLKNQYLDIEEKYQEELKKKEPKEKKENQYSTTPSNKTNSAINEIYKFNQNAEDIIEYLESPLIRASNEAVIFLKGNPGTGKSHLLADIALSRKEKNVPSILLLGQDFSNQHPKISIQQLLGINNSLVDYFKALESLAISKQQRILVIIDAINEGVGKQFWKTSIAGLLKELESFKWLGFVFSYRSTYEDLVIPDNLDYPTIEHNGFEGSEYEATKSFFSFYKIQQPRIPIINPEFSNPLFLKTFCLTLKNAGKSIIPEGYEGISKILDEYINSVNKILGERLRYPYKKINLVSRAIDKLLEHQIINDHSYIVWEDAYKLVEPILNEFSKSNSFLEELIKEGIFIEDRFYNYKTSQYEQNAVVFNYERFNEHLKALYLLGKFSSVQQLKKAFKKNGQLYSLFIDKYGYSGFQNGLLNAFSIIIPEKFNIEVYEIFKPDDNYANYCIYESFINSFVWRKSDSLNVSSWNYIRNYINLTESNLIDFFNTIFLVAANTTCCFNANFIHTLLDVMEIAERDFKWSIRIDKLFKGYKSNSIKRIIDWCWSSEDKSHIDDNSILLLGKLLSWFFTSSNRFLRDTSTKAFASLFINRINLLNKLVIEFKSVNDPYVLERIFAGSYGAIVHSSNIVSAFLQGIDFLQSLPCHLHTILLSQTYPTIILVTKPII